MRYSDYIVNVTTLNDLKKYKEMFEKNIANKQKELADFIERAYAKIEKIESYEASNQFCILGYTYREGRIKKILLIKRYPDGTQRDERYSFEKMSDLRKKLQELREFYSGVDWSQFQEEI